MKKIVLFLSLLLLLTGCASGNYKPPFNYKAQCGKINTQKKLGQVWLDNCLEEPKKFVNAELYKDLMLDNKDNVCAMTGHNNSAFAVIANEVARKRKVDCTPYYRKLLTTIDTGTLCQGWYNRGQNVSFINLVDNEVRRRGADCLASVTADRQNAAMEDQAAAIRGMAIQNAINANRIRTTNCTGFGNYTTCSSY